MENDLDLFKQWAVINAKLASRHGDPYTAFTLRKDLYLMAKEEQFDFSDDEIENIAKEIESEVGVANPFKKG